MINLMSAFFLYSIRVSKGGFKFFDWQLAQSRVYFLPKSQKVVPVLCNLPALNCDPPFDTLIFIGNFSQ